LLKEYTRYKVSINMVVMQILENVNTNTAAMVNFHDENDIILSRNIQKLMKEILRVCEIDEDLAIQYDMDCSRDEDIARQLSSETDFNNQYDHDQSESLHSNLNRQTRRQQNRSGIRRRIR
jgi:hypothetical protein